MVWRNKVLWSEGMFLRTQHFQQFERYLDARAEDGLRWLNAFGYGFVDLEIDEGLLRTGTVALARATGILPDGTMFDAPGRDDHPRPIEVPASLRNGLIHLALPIRRAGAYETRLEASGGDPLRWRGQEVDVADTVAGSARSATITVGKLDLALIDDRQELAGYVTLPVARVVERRADGSVVLDKNYVPTAMSCDVSPRLRGFLAEMRGLLQHRGAAIAGRLGDPGGKSIAEITDFLILMLVNRNETVFRHLGARPGLHPEAFYAALLGLAGELATFTEAGSNRPPAFAPYDHNDLQATFEPVVDFLREALSAVFEQTAIPIPLEDRAYGIRVARITDRSLFADCTFVIAASSSIDADILRQNLPKRTKIGSVERIRDLVNLQLGGAPVRPLQAEPRQIPFRANMVYFEINTTAEDWRLVERSAGAAIHVSGDVPDLVLELWAIRGRVR